MASLWRKKKENVEDKEEERDVEGYYILNDALNLIAEYEGKAPAFDDPEDEKLLESFVSRLLGATYGIGLPLQDWSRLVQAKLDENPLYVTKTDEDGGEKKVLVKEIPTSVVLHPAALVAAYRAVDMFPENAASMTTCLIERYEAIGFKKVKKEVAKLDLTGVTMGNAWFGVEGVMKG